MVARRHWFLAFLILLGIWVGMNLLVENNFENSLRPFIWIIEQIGFGFR